MTASTHGLRWLHGLIAAWLVLGAGHAHASPAPAARRIAVLVGANAAPAGRRELRYAHDDARRMADTLERVGGFARADVHLLLEPSAAELLQLLAALAARQPQAPDTLLLFYYSGHSDGQALYPRGEPLALATLREQLQRVRARVRVGILDTCRGGSWTQAKDLSVGPPLPPSDIAALGSEGSVLVAASAGFEDAHEAAAVGGSFFTHHLTAGLLGAADQSEDGSITVQEAFEYARERTVRDSARYAPVPQHPSFAIDLRGRQDLVLSQIGAGQNSLALVQSQGPLEVIRLASGTTVAESPAGARRARLVLPQGRYLIRRVADGEIYSLEVDVPAGGHVTVVEHQLRISDSTALAMKGAEPAPLSRSSTLPAGYWEWSLGLGVATGPAQSGARGTLSAQPQSSLEREFAFETSLMLAFTDRLQWALPLPAFAYRLGDEGKIEVIPRLGLVEFGWSSTAGLLGAADAGMGLRLWTATDQSVIASVSGANRFSIRLQDDQPETGTNSWSAMGVIGYGWTIHNTVSVYFGAAYCHRIYERGTPSERQRATANVVLLGGVLSIGYRALPLLQLHLSPTFALNLDASWAISYDTSGFYDRYLAGFTWQF